MPTLNALVTTPDIAPQSQPAAPAGPPRTVCLVNLISYPVMLSGYVPEDDADALPSVGAIVPRGGEIEFGLPQTVDGRPEVIAHFDVIHPDGRATRTHTASASATSESAHTVTPGLPRSTCRPCISHRTTSC